MTSIKKLVIKLGKHGVRHTRCTIRKQLAHDAACAKWAFIFDQGEFGCNYWGRV